MTESENADKRIGMGINSKRGGSHGIDSELTHSINYFRVSVCDGQKKMKCSIVSASRPHEHIGERHVFILN